MNTLIATRYTDLAAQLCRAPANDERSAKAETAALLRFSRRVENFGPGSHLDIEPAAEGGAQRLLSLITTFTHCRAAVIPQEFGARCRPLLRLHHQDVENLARIVGLITRSGYPIVGLPPWIVAGNDDDVAAAALRGAVLAAGRLIRNNHSGVSVYIATPGFPAALALRGLARRLGALARLQEQQIGRHAGHHVWLSDRRGMDEALVAMGAHELSSPPYAADQIQHNAAGAIEAVRAVVARFGDALPESLAAMAHARLSDPEASVDALAKRCGITRSAAYSRLRRIHKLSGGQKATDRLFA